MRAEGFTKLRRLREGPVHAGGQERARDGQRLGPRAEESQRRCHKHERGLVAVALNLHGHGGAVLHRRGRAAPHPRRQAQHGRPCRLRAAEQDRRHGRPPQGGHEDQPLPLCPRERDLGAGGRQVVPHPVPRLKAHPAADGLPRRQHQDGDGGQLRPRGLQLRRDALHAQVRVPRQEHQEQAQDQRGPQGRHDPGVPGRDHAPQGGAGGRRRRRGGRAAAARRGRPGAEGGEEDRVRREDRREDRGEGGGRGAGPLARGGAEDGGGAPEEEREGQAEGRAEARRARRAARPRGGGEEDDARGDRQGGEGGDGRAESQGRDGEEAQGDAGQDDGGEDGDGEGHPAGGRAQEAAEEAQEAAGEGGAAQAAGGGAAAGKRGPAGKVQLTGGAGVEALWQTPEAMGQISEGAAGDDRPPGVQPRGARGDAQHDS
mmetsp:Transcript_61331/g.159217  ORF Transcript_61331/g.159217 Transcript_61331/m.159217 type:complete len:430 (-) Transcript_61331:1000-2289(-)